MALDQPLPQAELVQHESGRILSRVALRRLQDALSTLGKIDHARAVRLQGELGQASAQLLRELAHAFRVRTAVRIERDRADAHGLTEAKQRIASEHVLSGIIQTRRDQLDFTAGKRGSPESDASSTALQRPQARVAVRGALGEQSERAALTQKVHGSFEHRTVLGRVVIVLFAIDRKATQTAHKASDHGHPEQRLLGEQRHRALGKTENEQWIDQPVRMVQREHDLARARQLLLAGNLDLSKEDPERQAADQQQQRSDHALRD